MAYGQILGQVQGTDAESIARIVNAGWVRIAKWETAGNYTWEAPDLFGGRPYQIGVVVIGGGGSGGAVAWKKTTASDYAIGATGGGSGFLKSLVLSTTANKGFNIVVGNGGATVQATANSNADGFTQGNDGKASSLKTDSLLIESYGGQRGDVAISPLNNLPLNDSWLDGGYGGQPSGAVLLLNKNNLNYLNELSNCDAVCCGTLVVSKILYADRGSGSYTFRTMSNDYSVFTASAIKPSLSFPKQNGYGANYSCYNPFTGLYMLGAGGGAIGIYLINSYNGKEINFYDEQGNVCHGGGGVADTTNTATAVSARDGKGAGCGGGGCVNNGRTQNTYTSISGAGADGAVYIYARGVDPDKYAV